MATPEEKKKKFTQPVNIYAPGTPTAKAQGNFPSVPEAAGKVFQSAANIAENYAGGAGLRKMVAPIVDASNKNQQYMDNQKLNSNITPASERATGTGERVVGGNMPVFTPPKKDTSGMAMAGAVPAKTFAVPEPSLMASHAPTSQQSPGVTPTVDQTTQPGVQQMIPGSGWIRNESTGESVAMGPGGKIIKMGPDGKPIDDLSSKIGMNDASQAGQRSFPVGNMDVQFDKSVSPEAQQRFAAPTGQQQGGAPTWDDMSRQFQNRSFAGEFGGGRPAPTQGQQLFTRENSPNMGWKERAKLNEQMMTNQQSGKNNELANKTAQDRNSIDAMNVAGQNQERQSTIANQQFALNQTQQLTQLQDQYASEQDPTKKKMLEDQLRARGVFKDKPKQQIVTRDVFDDAGVKTGQEFLTPNENGQLVPVQVGGGGQYKPAPADEKQRKVGAIYDSPKGPVRWDGKVYTLVR